jgi:hypothetical protein
MSEETQMEDIIEDVTEEQLIANEELVQDLPEASQEQEVSFSESITSVLLGEKKAVKENDDEDEEDEEEDEEDEEEDLDEASDAELEEAAKKVAEETLNEYRGGYRSRSSYGRGYARSNSYGGAQKKVYSIVYNVTFKTGEKAMRLQYGRKADYEDVREYIGRIMPDAEIKKITVVDSGYSYIDESVKLAEDKSLETTNELSKDEYKEEKYDDKKKEVKEALDVLMSNEASLSEGFKSEASTLFEAAIAEKSIEIQEKLEAKYNNDLNEEVETLRESLIERMDSYLSYVVESWIEENTEQVETTLRSEIAENFMVSLKDLFVENYIEVPAEKRDIVEELASTSEERLSQIVEKEAEIEELAAQVESFERSEVLAELAEDLSAHEEHRLNAILEGVEFESKEAFAAKAETIKESIFETTETVIENTETSEVEGETEIIIEGNDTSAPTLPASMQQYVKALSK